MMSKPLAGKRYFDALGRMHAHTGDPIGFGLRAKWRDWPTWAKEAFENGFRNQANPSYKKLLKD